jgi:hypothetical protein
MGIMASSVLTGWADASVAAKKRRIMVFRVSDFGNGFGLPGLFREVLEVFESGIGFVL